MWPPVVTTCVTEVNEYTMEPEQLLPDLWRFEDTCNVYVVKRGQRAIAIDFGSGRWMAQLPALGISGLDHVFLTHHHADQCAGLQAQATWPFTIHAPAGEEKFLDPAQLARGSFEIQWKGCPNSYAALPGGVPNARYDMAGFTDLFWGDQRIRFVHTPGHGPNACSIILDHAGKQVVFCGDAAHAGATLWHPYHLEWDHWTGQGALAAWEGLVRLHGIGVDLLCPSHGPVVADKPRAILKELSDRVMAFYLAKGQISPGENDDYLTPTALACGAWRVLPSLYQFGTNGYLLRSSSGEGLVVDPQLPDMPALQALLDELGDVRVTACAVSHYHFDHCDGVPYLQSHYGAKAYLHPWVAEPLRDVSNMDVPWLPKGPILADELWPEDGTWRWHEYEFRVAPWPGQTRWHCVFMAKIDGQKVALGGDSFQPTSRWNGTGGFCAYNGSRFEEGFAASAQLLIDWKPDVVACGHATYYRFHASKFRKIIRWAKSAQRATAALCPSGELEQDYYLVSATGQRRTTTPGALYWVGQ
jgi:glyoxylase-like metal-dependent hydrolase (beta-lactamase superfamily II)